MTDCIRIYKDSINNIRDMSFENTRCTLKKTVKKVHLILFMIVNILFKYEG